MGVDYYYILGLTRSAQDADVKRAYRKLALKLHPEKNKDDSSNDDKFKQIAEAYEVLVDPRKRATYDQFGEEGLKKGVPEGVEGVGAWTHGYVFHGDAHKTFREFFGGDNPFQEFYDRVDGDMTMSFGGLYGRGRKQQYEPVMGTVDVTLEEAYGGCVKKMKLNRRVLNDDGHTTSIRDKMLSMAIGKGWRPGTRITFPRESDQQPNNIPADIVFVLQHRPHARFQREHDNLVFTANVHLLEALVGCVIEVITLDDRVLNIPINDVIYPGYEKVIPNEGMPVPTDPDNSKGDLVIRFNIMFPRKVSPDQKHMLHWVFQTPPEKQKKLLKVVRIATAAPKPPPPPQDM